MNSIKRIEVIYDNRLVGRLALTKRVYVHLNIRQSGSILVFLYLRLSYHCAVGYL